MELVNYQNPSFLVACGFNPCFTKYQLAIRSYPAQFGQNLLRAYEQHLQECPAGRRDLRFKPQYNKWMSEQKQFQLLPLGDVWEEARLVECIDYLMTSSKCRTVESKLEFFC